MVKKVLTLLVVFIILYFLIGWIAANPESMVQLHQNLKETIFWILYKCGQVISVIFQ